MQKKYKKLSKYSRETALWTAAVVAVGGLLLYKLGTLTHGLGPEELRSVSHPAGVHAITHESLYLPLILVRTVFFKLFPDHGFFIDRLPEVMFGSAAIIAMYILMKQWHGKKIALMAGLLFATSAWTLHSSRYASTDVLYLFATPALLLIHGYLKKYAGQWRMLSAALLIWGLLLYVPGLIWPILLSLVLQWHYILSSWRESTLRLKLVDSIIVVAGLIPIVWHARHLVFLKAFLGLPNNFEQPVHLLKQIVAVPVHLFYRGPLYPERWLARTPVLDVFTLAIAIIGIYFYLTHLHAHRSKLLVSYGVLGVLLVGIGGPVSLSLLVPLLFLAAATGIAYLLHQWLGTFPRNPVARAIGYGLIALALLLASFYNLRAYFIAWPHNETTISSFHYRQ